jgi:hypothetical protein
MTRLDEQLAEIRVATAARLRRFLAHRGTTTAFARAEGIGVAAVWQLLNYYEARGGPLGAAIERARGSKGCLTEADMIPCTLCGLRGHVAGDPDRCYQQISLGLGGSQLRGR